MFYIQMDGFERCIDAMKRVVDGNLSDPDEFMGAILPPVAVVSPIMSRFSHKPKNATILLNISTCNDYLRKIVNMAIEEKDEKTKNNLLRIALIVLSGTDQLEREIGR